MNTTDRVVQKSIYTYQHELLQYLLSIDSMYTLCNDNTSIYHTDRYVFDIGIDYIVYVYNNNNMKYETMILSIYLWHKLHNNVSTMIHRDDYIKYVNPCIWIASKNEEYYPIQPYRLVTWLNTYKKYKSSDIYIEHTIDNIVSYEHHILSINRYLISTPPILSYIELIKSDIIHNDDSNINYISMNMLECSYYCIDIFIKYKISLLSLSCVSYACSMLDHTNVLTSHKDYNILGYTRSDVHTTVIQLKKYMKTYQKKIK